VTRGDHFSEEINEVNLALNSNLWNFRNKKIMQTE
jgi:hypothetical protein